MNFVSRGEPLEGAQASHQLLAARVDSLPGVLRDVLAQPLADSITLPPSARFVVTGIGGSEAPARIVAATLRAQLRARARFVPMSALVCEPFESDPTRDVLVLISHGLSPTSRSVLAQRARFAACVLFTGRSLEQLELTPCAAPIEVHTHPPAEEPGLLVRVLAPAAATLAALRWIASLTERAGRALHSLVHLDAVPDAVARVLGAKFDVPAASDDRVGIVSMGDDAESFAHGLRWKWLEAVGRGDPPCWDALAFAHGPFQDLWDQRAVVWALMHTHASREHDVVERLTSMMHAGRHRVVRVIATLPKPLGWFEHDAWFDRAVLRELHEHPRDLAQWPGKGRDEALYAMT